MRTSELRHIIREEAKKIIKEESNRNIAFPGKAVAIEMKKDDLSFFNKRKQLTSGS